METEQDKIDYIRTTLGAQMVYKVVPTKMVITQPYMLSMGGDKASCAIFTTKGDDGYAYPSEFLSESFLDEVIADKQANSDYQATIDEMFPEVEITDDMSEEEKTAAESSNANREVLLGANTCGIKTQQILTNFIPVE